MENVTGAATAIKSVEDVAAEIMASEEWARFDRGIEENKEYARRFGRIEHISGRITVGKNDYKLNAWARGDMLRIYITTHRGEEKWGWFDVIKDELVYNPQYAHFAETKPKTTAALTAVVREKIKEATDPALIEQIIADLDKRRDLAKKKIAEGGGFLCFR